MPRLAELLKRIAQPRQLRVVARRKARERHLLIAGVVARLHTVPRAQVHAAVSHRAVDVPRLTEAAAADAPAEQLEHHAILHDLRAGDDGFRREERLVHIADDALGHNSGCAVQRRDGCDGAVGVVAHVVQARDIDAVELRRAAEKFPLCPALAPGLPVQLHQLDGDVLPLAKAHKVDKIRNRLGVVHRRTTCDDERRQLRALGAVQRDPREIEHVQNGREGHLISDGKGHDIKVRDRVAGFQREQRHVRRAHLLLHVPPRGEHPLAPDAGHLVHHAVENPHAKVRHADLIGIGEAEGDAGIHLRKILHHRVILAAHIARGLLHAGQDAFQSLIHSKSPDVGFVLITLYFTCFAQV